jgi:hypothetical protein
MAAAVGAASLPAASVATQWQDCPPSVVHGSFSYVACDIVPSALAMAVTSVPQKYYRFRSLVSFRFVI